MPKEMPKGSRLSREHARLSFDVEVVGPFLKQVDPTLPKPELRHAATLTDLPTEITGPPPSPPPASPPKAPRYSKEHGRLSFDVDVRGPFPKKLDKRPKPKMRNVATLAMMVEEVEVRTPISPVEETESPDMWDWWEEDEHQAGGDAAASSINTSDKDETEQFPTAETSVLSKRKSKLKSTQCKQHDVGTMARPRGYRELNLRGEDDEEQTPAPTAPLLDAETQTTPYELEKEMAKQRGSSLPKDNIIWPTCQEFDIDGASKKIEDYIKRCWKLSPKWLFVVQPLEVYHDNFRKKYIFEVKFSIPTSTTPVPQATASVFFVFEIPTYSTKTDPLRITYVLEGSRFPHKPGKIPFKDKWLWGIITDKMKVQKAVNF